MPLTVSKSVSGGINCELDDGKIIPAGDFSYILTLLISGASSITSISYLDGAPEIINVTGSGLVWTISIVPGESIFPDESFKFVQYDSNFNSSTTEVPNYTEAPPNSTVFKYKPPNPFSRSYTFQFLVNYITSGEDGSPMMAAIEIINITQKYIWDPSVGLGNLQVAINNSRY